MSHKPYVVAFNTYGREAKTDSSAFLKPVPTSCEASSTAGQSADVSETHLVIILRVLVVFAKLSVCYSLHAEADDEGGKRDE